MRENISVSVYFLKFTGNYPYKQELLSYRQENQITILLEVQEMGVPARISCEV